MITNKAYKSLLFSIFILSVLCKFLIIDYALPFLTHVDEATILKDPLKILLQYVNKDFSTPTNLYNWIIVFWHFITFIIGLLFNYWKSIDGYTTQVSINAPIIIYSFRFLNLLISSCANLLVILFITRKTKGNNLTKLLFILVILLNPIEWNSNGFVKFDAICYLLYIVYLYIGYEYFIENKPIRNLLYIALFIGVATRIENIAFLAGFTISDFLYKYNANIRLFFSGKYIRTILIGIIAYSALTLVPVTIFYNILFEKVVNYTKTKTFEEVIFSNLSISSFLGYTYYLNVAFYLLSPVVVIGACLQIFKDKIRNNYLLIPLLLLNVILALNGVKNMFYFLASSVILIFLFVFYLEGIKQTLWKYVSLIFVVLYFLTFDSELLYFIRNQNVNSFAREVVLSHSIQSDTILLGGIADLGILESEKNYGEKIQSIKEIGGSTGKGLEATLKIAQKNPTDTRNIFRREEDYFWKGTKYQNKWLIGMDSIRLSELKPKLIVLFSPKVEFNKNENKDFLLYLNKHYVALNGYKYDFIDKRMKYRNIYYFHSSQIFLRK